MFLYITDIDSRLILADEVDELLLNRVHPVHAAVLDLLLMDFGEVSSKESQGGVWVDA